MLYQKSERIPPNIMANVFNSEGGYQNNVNDRGNYHNGILYGTNMGITPGTLVNAMNRGIVPRRPLSQDAMRSLTRNEVIAIYTGLYWKPSSSNNLPYPLSYVHIDTSILHGVGTAARYLQRAINQTGENIGVDGLIGPITLGAMNNISNNKDRFKQLCFNYLNIRMNSYDIIVRNNPSQRVFLNGWRNRTNRIRRQVEEAFK